jgi:murein DD-endopeptidase MepM/ murein hydrolase activator NlpD
MRAKLMEMAGKRSAIFAACAFGLVLLSGCGSDPSNDWADNGGVAWNSRPHEAISRATYFTVVVHRGDTMSAIASRYDTSADELSHMNDRPVNATLYPGDVLHVPANGETRGAVMREATNERAAYAPPTEKDRHIASYDPAIAPRAIDPRDRVAVREEPPVASTITPRTKPSYAPTPNYASAPPIQSSERLSADTGSGEFCAPVNGRIIEGFGDTGNGQRNDGINIAAPAGTPIRAAADGTVSYAGNELKGYGNLILIKQDDGYITAYAHANSIGVARGQHVGRGDVIGTVGQTGDVNQPQLHFEVRQGMKPVDPRPMLMASAS